MRKKFFLSGVGGGDDGSDSGGDVSDESFVDKVVVAAVTTADMDETPSTTAELLLL